ncbi:BTAD domain-containing putative transcriptional regulator [Nocardiopsis composta]
MSTVEGLPAPLSAAASAAAGAGAGYLLGRRSRRSAEKAEPAAEQAGAPTGTKAPPDMETATPGPSDQPPAARQEPAPAAGTGAGDLLAGASAGLSVTGPAAPQTIAALLAHAAQDGAPVIATAAALQRLAPATPLPEVKTVGGWEAALVRAEAHLLAAHRDAASAVPPVLLIEPPPSEEGKAKLSALLAADLPARIIVADGFAAAGWHLEAAPTALHLRGPDGQEREADLGELLDPHAAVSNTPKAGPEEAAKEHRSAEEAEAGEPVPGENPAGDQGPPAAATPPTTLGVRVRLFAPRVVVEADGADISTRMRGSARTLLALLATRPEGISAEEAAETLAPGVEAARARAARNNAVSSARRAIRDATGNTQAAVIETDNARLRLEDSALIQVDLWDFDHACQAARKTSDPGRSRRLGAEIRALYQADLLAEISESWVESERERCRRQAAHLFTDLARKAEEVGEKIEWLHEACAIDRYNESLHRALMETQTKAGRPDDAHRTYRTLAENLAALGERPGKELREAAVKLAAHTPALNAE